MAISGGWRVLVGALVLSASVVAPATASADPVTCARWTESDLPGVEGLRTSNVSDAAGSYVVGNGVFRWGTGSSILIWKDRQLVDELSFGKHGPHASDVNSSGVVLVNAAAGFSGASRWQAGVYTGLKGWQGEYDVKAVDINERGDVLGESGGKPVLWPAGSDEAQLVPGTDESWSAIGLADDGTILAATTTGVYWLGGAEPVQLSGGTDVQVKAMRNSYAVGWSGQGIVRWDRQGQVSPVYTGAMEVQSVNSHGQMVGVFNNQTTVGMPAVWYDPEQYPVSAGTSSWLSVIADDGTLYGSYAYDSWSSRAVVLDCEGARR
ncbi:hypothetical protein [Lentzea sp. NPDC051838]|uniref:hypothetical protein n=1 Tax=Lentzea sp. NPDC051838 TaxID=3154849 RepID=UPI00342FDEF5